MRITVAIDDDGQVTVTHPEQIAGAIPATVAADDGGAAPGQVELLTATATGALNAGPPPDWLVHALEGPLLTFRRDSSAINGDGQTINAGPAPTI